MGTTKRFSRILLMTGMVVCGALLLWWQFTSNRGESPPPDETAPEAPVAATPSTPEPAPVPVPEEAPYAEGEENGTIQISGRVLNARTAEPISAFDVVFLEMPPLTGGVWRGILANTATPWQARQSADGSFTITGTPGSGPFAVGVKADGFEAAHVTVASDDTQNQVVLRLQPEVLVTGTVVSPEGTGVYKAEVLLDHSQFGRILTFTDRKGAFEVVGLPEKELTLYASGKDYLPGSTTVTPARGTTQHVEIRLGLGGRIEGEVRRGRDPLKEVNISVLGDEASQFRKDTKTDAHGRYAVRGLPEGEVTVLVRHIEVEGQFQREPTRRKAIIEEGSTTVADFEFPAEFGTVSGVVSFESQTLAGGLVKATSSTPYGETTLNARLNETGRFDIANLPPGQVRLDVEVMAEGGALRMRRATIELGEGENVQHDVLFKAGGSVEGSVAGIPAGTPCHVLLFHGEIAPSQLDTMKPQEVDEVIAASVPADKSGSFRMTGIEAGQYTVIAIGKGTNAETGKQSFADGEGQTFTVTVKDGETTAADFDFSGRIF